MLYLTLVTHVRFVRRFRIRYSLAVRNGDGDAFDSGVQPSTAMESIGVAGTELLDGAHALTSALQNIRKLERASHSYFVFSR